MFDAYNSSSKTMLRWRPNTLIGLVLCSAVFIFFLGYTNRPWQEKPRVLLPAAKGELRGTWNYNRDAKNLKLTDAQCDEAFPDLFREIDRAVESRKKHHVTIEEIDQVPVVRGYLRAMIYNQELYMINATDEVNSRNQATLHALYRAMLTSPEPLPNAEFTLNADDKAPEQATWSFARLAEHKKSWLMPDFGYFSWPEPKIGSYNEVQTKAIAVDAATPWKNKISKLVWRGAIMGLKVRQDLLSAAEGKSWSDVKELNWQTDGAGETHDSLTMDEHCKYKFVAHTEGVSYSARLQNLQNCRSVIVAHKLKWIQHHSHLMESSGPDQNFIEVEDDFSNLDDTMNGLLEKDKDGAAELERIAENNVRIFRDHYLTAAAETCYWRKLIRGWASVSPEPEFYKKKDGKKVWRGLPVESYFLERRMDWDLH